MFYIYSFINVSLNPSIFWKTFYNIYLNFVDMLIGVVGKANVGKSTFFKALTLAEVEISNYPFVTIKPNHGVGYVRVECVDKEFNVQCQPREGYCINHNRFVPVELLDVAGLVPGAHKGKGLGNQFLDDLRQADALIHVIDISGSTNENGEPVAEGTYDPANDIKFLEYELDMWYLNILKKVWDKFSRQTVQEKQESYIAIAKQFSGLKANEDIVKEILNRLNLKEIPLNKWSEDDLIKFSKELRKATKPMIIAANKIDTKAGQENYEKIKNEFPDYKIIPCSAESELALKEAVKHGLIEYIPGDSDFKIIDESKLTEKQKNALNFIRENVLKKYKSTGVQNVINEVVFNILNYIAVFPGGVNKLSDSEGRILPDCFLMPKGTTALDFAYKLHTDLGNNFIKAIDVRRKIAVGKDYILKNRDVIEIVTSK